MTNGGQRESRVCNQSEHLCCFSERTIPPPLKNLHKTKLNKEKTRKYFERKREKMFPVSDVTDSDDDDDKSNNKIMYRMLTIINNSVFYI